MSPSPPAERLRHRIRADGPVPFAAFMEEALYGAGGYYARRESPIGTDGDFVTGASLSPLFGRVTARLLERLDRPLGWPAELLEAGYGDAAHLAVVAERTGARRRLRAWDRVPRPVPEGVEAVADLEAVSAGEVRGLVFSYELFDALPVHRLVGRPGGDLGELWVGLDREGRFRWVDGELSNPALATLVRRTGTDLDPGQVADLSPGWVPLYRRLAERLGAGLLVTCDYGFEAARLLDSRIRRHGTLACHRRHRVHRDPFAAVGEQDLTAHVDFSALRGAGEEAGLATVAFTRQALWLTACGLFEELAGEGERARHDAAVLLDGEGMGEEIRVLVQSRGLRAERVLDLGLLGGAGRAAAPRPA